MPVEAAEKGPIPEAEDRSAESNVVPFKKPPRELRPSNFGDELRQVAREAGSTQKEQNESVEERETQRELEIFKGCLRRAIAEQKPFTIATDAHNIDISAIARDLGMPHNYFVLQIKENKINGKYLERLGKKARKLLLGELGVDNFEELKPRDERRGKFHKTLVAQTGVPGLVCAQSYYVGPEPHRERYTETEEGLLTAERLFYNPEKK